MSNIVWKNSRDLVDLKELLAKRQDFTFHGILEKISADGTSIKVRLFEKDRQWHGQWFNISEDFDLESLRGKDYPLIEFIGKIQTFFGKEGLLRTLVTFTNWTEAEDEPESSLLTLENVTLISNIATDQPGLYLFGFQKQNELGAENYHIRLFTKGDLTIPSTKADVNFKLRLTQHQLTTDGVRKTGFEDYEYEKDGQTVTGTRTVYRFSLEADSINWK